MRFTWLSELAENYIYTFVETALAFFLIHINLFCFLKKLRKTNSDMDERTNKQKQTNILRFYRCTIFILWLLFFHFFSYREAYTLRLYVYLSLNSLLPWQPLHYVSVGSAVELQALDLLLNIRTNREDSLWIEVQTRLNHGLSYEVNHLNIEMIPDWFHRICHREGP